MQKALNIAKILALLIVIVILAMNQELIWKKGFSFNARTLRKVNKEFPAVTYLLFFVVIAHFCSVMLGIKVIREKLILIKDLGVQLESESLNGASTKRFVDLSRIRDIVINEVILFLAY